LKVVSINETGSVHFESRPGEEDDFLACYRSQLDARLRGRFVDMLGSPRRTTVSVDPLRTSFVVVATINSTHRARLLVDTGATLTILRPRLVERVEGAIEVEGLRRTIVGATGDKITVSLWRLRSFAIGSFEVEDLHVGVHDVIPQLPEIDGLLGTDFLHRFVVNIDGGARQLSLEKLP
jgi:predicted aspartyl protease